MGAPALTTRGFTEDDFEKVYSKYVLQPSDANLLCINDVYAVWSVYCQCNR
jgi:glycine/serine hydroxymethyltransferase